MERRAATAPFPASSRRRRSPSFLEATTREAAHANGAAVIDLRSDTVTRPTAGMRAAIANARVENKQMREDPTVNELQERVATLLGQEQALFLPTATMANQIALKLHGRPGDVLIRTANARLRVRGRGGARGPARRGRARPGGPHHRRPGGCGDDDVEDASDQKPAVVVLENTHNVRRRARLAARRARRRRRTARAARASASTWTARGC